MCGFVNHDFLNDMWCAISKLSAFVRWITSKEIYIASIPWWHQERFEIVFMFEKELSSSFMDLQVHLLIHLVEEVELVRVVSCRWMFFFEMFMKKVKGFVQQRAKTKGYMANRYIVYGPFYYVVSTSIKSTMHQAQ